MIHSCDVERTTVSPLEIVSELLNVIFDDVPRSRLRVADPFTFAKMNSEQNSTCVSTVSVEVKNGTEHRMYSCDTFSRFEGEKVDCNTGIHNLSKRSNKMESTGT